MTQAKIGVQMMMLKQKAEENGVYETLRELSNLGYRSVEVSQIPMTKENVAELKRGSADFSIKIAALSAPVEPMALGVQMENLTDDFDKIVDDCKELDCMYLRIGMLPVHIMGDKEKIMAFIDRAEALAKRLAYEGIQLYYHTHHIEFQKYNGEYLLDLMKNNTKTLGFELDVHWIQRAGENPINLIKQYQGRIGLLHLKDYRIGQLDVSEEALKDMKAFFGRFTNLIEFAELGEGNLDLKAIIEAGLDAGVEHFFIEQDDTYGRDPFECLKISGEHLRELGYSHMF
ncbi:sugar phosphate isomerase/epimerase family protein [Alkalicoccobacillus gibsonii]|uniref:sugar phosphate isomerase/epimerase family protein n=1 Tax=Alkalicoccobacillus gibsonii TaxID=79881 RepID=UPI0019341765|nr:sugar phosphate isomerase/epimerase [Alkalicoccobacillus gibsonii]MBM0065451.1 sugar phosphate isomerase/epimerase [Alkalicoccobacillus gibsonii]